MPFTRERTGEEGMDSIWEKNVQLPRFPELEGKLCTDVLIVGGGLAGLLCAWKLTRAGVPCALIEENRIMQNHRKGYFSAWVRLWKAA